jgi:glycosyltransferase involved in cell wall biosynthesis
MASRQRCIIIDPNQRLQQSHNYRYNRIIHRNAREAGYDVVMLFNKADQSDFSGVDASISKCFSHSSYDYLEIRSVHRNPKVARFGQLVEAVWRRLTAMPRPDMINRFPDVGLILNFLWRTLIVLLFPLIYAVFKLYNFTIYKRRPFYDDLFARELAAELRKLRLKDGDIVVMHSGNFAMIEALFLLRPHMGLTQPFPVPLHMVFHHSMTEAYGESFNLDYYQRAEPKWLQQRCENGLPFSTLHLYGTNEGLCEELTALSGMPFKLFNHIEETDKFGDRITQAEAKLPDPDAALRVGVRAKDILGENRANVAAAMKAFRDEMPNAEFVLLGNRAASADDLQRFIQSVPGIQIADTASDSAYLDQLAGLDVLLQPYRQADYAKRVSAVFVECALLGIPVIAPDNTTMSKSADMGHVFAYADAAKMDGAVKAFLKARDKAGFGPERLQKMEAARAFFLRNCVTHDFLPAIKPAAECAALGPVAVVVSPFWGQCGSTTVFDSNTEYLLKRGYFVFRIMVCNNRLGVFNLGTIFQFHQENSQRVRPHGFLLASRTRFTTIRAFLTPSFWRKSAFGQINHLNGGAVDHDKRLARYIFDNTVVAIVNHSFNIDYARRFRKAKIVLETQDIQARQIASQNQRNLATQRMETEADHLRDEIGVWRYVDATVNLSKSENDVIIAHCPRSTYVRPYITSRKITLKRDWSTYVETNKLDPSFRDIDSIDLMLWGDAHPLNVQSTQWFLENVVLGHPDLAQKTILIGGRLGQAIYQRMGSRPKWYYTGYLDTLDDCFLKSKLLVLPDQVGTGMSIKTLETLAIGLPFTSSLIAMRGIDMGDTGYVPSTDAAEMQQDILALLASPKSRKQRAQVAERLFKRNFDPEFYYQTWDTVIESVGLPARTKAEAPVEGDQ